MLARTLALLLGLVSSIGGVAAARPDTRAPTVRSWLIQYHAGDRIGGEDEDARYAAAYADLNGDGVDEALVYLQSRSSCGSGGCNLYVLASRGGYWRRVSGHTITRPPIRILPARHHGWRDLSVWVVGGGILQGYHAALPFDGKTYPLNPTLPPARRLPLRSPGKVLIGADAPLIPLRR